MVTAVYPGTFDPITHGHIDLITRACKLFDRIIIAVATGSGKSPLFSQDERIKLIREVFIHHPQVEVALLPGLLVDFAKLHQAKVIIRGLRTASDFDYEFQLAGMNRGLAPDIDTLFLTPSAEHAFVSSSLVREIAKFKGDIKSFVPEVVANALKHKNS